MSAATPIARPGHSEFRESDVDQACYVGLVTRTIGFVLDAAVINLVATVVGLAVALCLSLLHLSDDAKAVLAVVGGAVYILWSIAYFVGFWSTTGQTPGSRAMRIRIIPIAGKRLKLRHAFVRLIGVLVGALALGLGYVPILFDRRRRGLPDRLSHSMVVESPLLGAAHQPRLRPPRGL